MGKTKINHHLVHDGLVDAVLVEPDGHVVELGALRGDVGRGLAVPVKESFRENILLIKKLKYLLAILVLRLYSRNCLDW